MRANDHILQSERPDCHTCPSLAARQVAAPSSRLCFAGPCVPLIPGRSVGFPAVVLLVVISAEAISSDGAAETLQADAAGEAGKPKPEGSSAERSEAARVPHELAACLVGSDDLKQQVRELERTNIRLLRTIDDLQRGCRREPEPTAAASVSSDSHMVLAKSLPVHGPHSSACAPAHGMPCTHKHTLAYTQHHARARTHTHELAPAPRPPKSHPRHLYADASTR
jgi:hypothetical protein